MTKREGTAIFPEPKRAEEPSELLRELVAHLRQNRTQLREEWVVRITETGCSHETKSMEAVPKYYVERVGTIHYVVNCNPAVVIRKGKCHLL